jgi:peptide/nickel transport system permease protein
MFKKLKKFMRNIIAWGSITLIALFIFMAIFAPLISPHQPNDQDLRKRLLPPKWMEGGDPTYILGTDDLGRDVLARTIYGSRVSITAALMSGVIGTLAGLISGYYPQMDNIIMRIADIQLAFPTILLALVVVSVVGSGFDKVVLILGITGWVSYARVVRSEVLSVKQSDYIVAAQTLGINNVRILIRHILPNVIAPAVTIGTFQVASAIIAESSLSYLGLGIPIDIPSWGNMIYQGQLYIESAWWISVFPGLFIILVVLSINLLGDVLRDFMDPHTRHV